MEVLSDSFFKELEKTQSLVTRFEFDARNLIRQYILSINPEALLFLEPNIAKKRSKQRIADDDVDHLDFGEAIEVLQREKSLEDFLAADVRVLTAVKENLVSVRNRANHVKVLDEGDLDSFLELAERLNEQNWPNFVNIANSITRGNYKELSHQVIDSWTPVLNNLEQPDYSETSLIGRKEDEREILSRLSKTNQQVVQIVGPAGTGKSALALKVLYKVLENDGLGFDCVLWCSLKTERLTIDGVQEISGALTDLYAAVSSLGSLSYANAQH